MLQWIPFRTLILLSWAQLRSKDPASSFVPSETMTATLLTIQGEAKLWRLKKRRILGKGSFGMAILYEDCDTEGLVVVKDLNLQCVKKASDVEALHSEIQILKKTATHPNIVRYLDSYFDGKFTMQILMEYCDGGDLADRIDAAERSGAHLTETEVVSCVTQILMGLHHLHHDHRILHRDIKPQNIFLCSDGVVKLGDFGVSTMLSQNVEYAKTFCGSPYYLAPEMCEEKRYNGKADLWSCGVVFYELMALQRPFDGKNLVTLVLQITKAEYPKFNDTLPYSATLKDMVYSLLQLQPDHRPPIKRLLRSFPVTNGLGSIPSRCLESPFYTNQFGRIAPLTIPTTCTSVDVSGLSDLEAWAAADRDELLKTEMKLGLKPTVIVDRQMLDRTQLREMAAGKPNSRASEPISLHLTASADDQAWNEHYDDDDFEDDDEVLIESAPLQISMQQRSFRFSA